MSNTTATTFARARNGSPMLEVSGLSVSFVQYAAGLRQRVFTPITGLDVDVFPGEVLAIVGSSGSGKSLLAHAVLGILPSNARVAGDMAFDGEELTAERQVVLRGREVALVPQSVNYLDPLMRVDEQVRLGSSNGSAKPAQRRVFERYQLSEKDGRFFPFQLSGGMARRALVASAVVSDASLIIADEPTPGLHPEVVREALGHLRELADEGRAVVLITHDIDAALSVADRIAVFYAGTTVEIAPVADFHGDGSALRHPYTRALWEALPANGFKPIPGSQPPLDALPAGCLFEPRCGCATGACAEGRPEGKRSGRRMVRCVLEP